ncbi:MAG: ComF family protein, partial [Acidobacteria bacterium]|nr:ComF family protein [Acidobacteriota bacterium]
NLLFPLGNCRICGKKVKFGFPEICFSCLKKRKKIDDFACSICSREMAENSSIKVCGECLKEHPSYEKHISVYSYDGAIREMVLAFKVLKRYPFYRIFGKSVSRNVKKKITGVTFDFATYIPTPYFRRISRGFSPAELIAKKCAKELKVPVKDILKLAKRTKLQKNLTARERRENIKGAFKCAMKLKDKKILLIDDIFTTGATIEEASKALKKKGATVYCATFAMRRKRELDLEKLIED